MLFKPVSAAILLMVASSGIAQVQIIESQPIGRKSTPENRPTTAAVDAGAQAEMYYQLQQLQQEVQELRGLVEQQSFELRQLKQQRMDDYLDLDRRFSQLSNSSGANTAVPPSSSSSPDYPSNIGSEAAQADELAAYRGAIDLVLKKKDFDGGADALQKYLRDFPSGHYTANALYWLGQIYLQKNDSNQAQKWFKQMIDQYPSNQKTPEAKFKLARLYHAQGDKAQARKLLDDVASSNSPVSAMAREFLQQNF